MIGFVLLALTFAAVAGGSRNEDSHASPGYLDATTLYFHERTLTKSPVPVPQLICQNSHPSDGCALRRIVFAECHKAADEDWSAWRCQGHGDQHDSGNASGLDLHMVGIRCFTGAPDSCSLTYTLQYNNATVARIARETLARACGVLYATQQAPFEFVTATNLALYAMPGFFVGLASALAFVVFFVLLGELHVVVVEHNNAEKHYFLTRSPLQRSAVADNDNNASRFVPPSWSEDKREN